MSRVRPDLPVLGWKEQVSLPEWEIPRLRAKLDTGARSSALHVEELELPTGETGEVRFHLLLGSRERPARHAVRAQLVGYRMVRDTGANAERRAVVRTRIVCGPVDTEADVTLTSRTGMNFRMLLGRLTLAGHCLVDPEHGYLHTPAPRSRTQASGADGGRARPGLRPGGGSEAPQDRTQPDTRGADGGRARPRLPRS